MAYHRQSSGNAQLRKPGVLRVWTVDESQTALRLVRNQHNARFTLHKLLAKHGLVLRHRPCLVVEESSTSIALAHSTVLYYAKGIVVLHLDGFDELELHHRLHFELVLRHDPVGDPPVRGDTEKIELLRLVVALPVYLMVESVAYTTVQYSTTFDCCNSVGGGCFFTCLVSLTLSQYYTGKIGQLTPRVRKKGGTRGGEDGGGMLPSNPPSPPMFEPRFP